MAIIKFKKMGDINMYFPEMDYGPTECAHTIMLHHMLDNYLLLKILSRFSNELC